MLHITEKSQEFIRSTASLTNDRSTSKGHHNHHYEQPVDMHALIHIQNIVNIRKKLGLVM